VSTQNKNINSTKRGNRKKRQDPEPQSGTAGLTYRDPDAPPNDHVQKDPDEVYGDTTIPDRKAK
jgi:hypothetical protein